MYELDKAVVAMKNEVGTFLRKEDGITTVELILVLVALIAVVVIFKSEITTLVGDIFKKITSDAGKI